MPSALSRHHQGLLCVSWSLTVCFIFCSTGSRSGEQDLTAGVKWPPVCLCRYAQDGIYSHAGPVLIAVNPFKPVPLYAPDVVQRYKV